MESVHRKTNKLPNKSHPEKHRPTESVTRIHHILLCYYWLSDVYMP